jgi:hypothetical protein
MFPPGETSYPRILLLTGPILATLLIAASAGPVPSSLATPPLQKAREAENYGKIPLTFEANQGQADKSVKFLSRRSGYGVYLARHEAALILCKPVHGTSRADLHRNVSPVGKSAVCDVVHMQLAGANSTVEPTGEERLPGTVNYFVGSDPTKWHAGIPTYAKVRYTSIYPGVDLTFHGNPPADGPNGPSADGQLEFDFVIAPNADPRAVRLRLSESNHLHLAANGDLLVATANGALAFRKPLAYQLVDGQRHPIAGNFALVGRDGVRFQVGRYDRTKPLVIDPVLEYSTFLSGSGNANYALLGAAGNAVAVDSEGNAYVTGSVYSTNFPVTEGAFETTDPGAEYQTPTAFVTKLNATGTALVYSTYLGGSGGDYGSAIAVDAAGGAYVAGQTGSTNFPVTTGALQTTNKGAAKGTITGFVAKLNPSGTNLIYSTYLGGSTYDGANAIAVDAAGEAYVVGQTSSSDFPVTQGAYQTTNKAAPAQTSNAFVAKLNSAGTALMYATYLGGSGGPRMPLGGCVSAGGPGNNEDGAFAVAIDAAGDAYVAGQALSTDFPVTQGAFQTQSNGAASPSTNAFVAKLNPAGSGLIYSTYLGGSGLHLCGAEGVSASAGDAALALTVDGSGNAYVAGIAFSSDFPVTQGAFQTTNRSKLTVGRLIGPLVGGPTGFVAKLNPSGSALVYSTYLGGSGGIINFLPFFAQYLGDQASGLAIDGSGNAYVTGSTASTDFPVTPGAYQTTNNYPGGAVTGSSSVGADGYNAFVTEINPSGSALVYSTYLGGNGANPNVESGLHVVGIGDVSSALALDNSGNVYITGQAQSADFPVTSGAFQTTNPAFLSAFVAKLNMSATSPAITPTVTVTPASTTITSGRPLTVVLSVSGGSGNPTPTGTVTLVSGTYASPPATLAAGSATINIPAGSLPAEPAGNLSGDELTANYVPDTASSSTYNSSTGTATVYVVWPSISVTPSSTTLTWAQAQSQALPVAIGVTAGTGNPVPTGTVTLTTGSWSSAATALSGGSATISIPPGTLTTGWNTLNVSYSGDSNYAPENPAGSAQVNAGVVTVSVVPSASTINSTQALPVTINVSAGSGSPTATGTVWLYSGSYGSAPTPLVGGSATITIPAGTLAPGVDLLQADYQGGNYAYASGQASVTVTGPPGFTITGTAVTVTAGATTGNTSTITVTPSGGFTGSVALTAAVTSGPAGAQDPPTLSFGSTSPVNISGTAAGTATLTIATTAPNNCGNAAYQTPRGVFWYTGIGAALAFVLLFGVPARRRRWRLALAMLALLVALAVGWLACGGGGSIRNCGPIIPGTTAGTYTITVTGTSGAITATAPVALTVQ